ncbi:MAG: histidine--tRNA ligase, partial [Chloroflexi bacterium]
ALGNIPRIKGPFYFVATVGDFARGYGIGLLRKIRNMGVPADMSYEIKSLKAQMKIADRIGAVKAVIVGEEEINRGKVRVRDMETGEELLVEEDKLRDLYEEELKREKT